MKLRAAIVGCGRIGSQYSQDARTPGIHSHAHAYRACANTELVAVCDTNRAQLKRCARRWRVPGQYVDLEDFLDEERPDLVSVCTPDATHDHVLRTVLRRAAPRGVLVEKPLAMTAAQGRSIIRLARQVGTTLAVNYTRRYAENHFEVRNDVQGGRIGRLQALNGFYSKGTIHNGGHWFDLARFLAGEVKEVQAWNRLREPGPDPTLDVRMRLRNGPTAFLLSCDHRAYALFEMDLVGTRGRIRITDAGHEIERYTVGPSPRFAGYRSLRPTRRRPAAAPRALLSAVEDLARAVLRGARPRCTGEDGVAALAIAEAAHSSARAGKPIRVRGHP